jgi:ATP-dependent helicase HrpA
VRALKKSVADVQALRLYYAKVAADPWLEAASRADDRALPEQPDDVLDELLALAFDRAFVDEPWRVRDREAFERCHEAGRSRLGPALQEVSELAADILATAHRVRAALAGMPQRNWRASVEDMQAQLDRLVYRGFLGRTEPRRLAELPRYLAALEKRIDKLRSGAARDRQRMDEMADLQQAWQRRLQESPAGPGADPRLDEIGWLLEELRVSLFAQELKTPMPVSVKRVRRRWEALGL